MPAPDVKIARGVYAPKMPVGDFWGKFNKIADTVTPFDTPNETRKRKAAQAAWEKGRVARNDRAFARGENVWMALYKAHDKTNKRSGR